jgi:hypothetical protein
VWHNPLAMLTTTILTRSSFGGGAVVGLSSTISSYPHMDSIVESDSIAESSSTSMCGSGPRTALSPINRVLPLRTGNY